MLILDSLAANAVNMTNFAGPYDVPQPTAVEPPGKVSDNVSEMLNWLTWGVMIAAVVGLIICAFMMILGRRGRSQTAVEGATGIPWILGGLTLVAVSAALVNTIL